jgi:hypothetical protein
MRPLQTCFRSGSGYHCLNLLRRVTRRIILQKARRQGDLRPAPSTARKHTVSGSVALPSPGFFSPFPHGTVRYRSLCVVSLGEWAPPLQTGLLVSGPTQVPIPAALLLTNPALTVSGGVFQTPYVAPQSCGWKAAASPYWPCNPISATPAGLTRIWFGLIPVRSPLLRDFFRFLGVHEMFQFPRFPPASQVISRS